MKMKIVLVIIMAAVGNYAAFACGYADCGGGTAVCCKDGAGSTYYKAAPKPPKT